MASCFFSFICKNKVIEDDELKFAECKVNINKLPSHDEDIHRRPSFAQIQKKDEIKAVPQNSKTPMKEKKFKNVDAFQFDPFSDNAFESKQGQLTNDGTPTYGRQNSQKTPQSSYFSNGQMTPSNKWNQSMNASLDFGLSTDYEDNEYNEIRQQARNIVKPRDKTGTSNKTNNFSNVKDLDENCSSTAKSDCYFSDSGDDPESSSVDEKDKGNVSNNQFNSFTDNSKVAVQHAIVPNSSSISTSSFLIKQEEAPPTRFTFDDIGGESPPSQRKSKNAAFDRNLNSMSATKVKKTKSPTIGTNGRKHETSDSAYQGTNSRKQDQVFEDNHKTSNAHGKNSFSHNDGFPESFADFDNDGFLFESKKIREANTGSVTKSTSDHVMQSKEQNIGNEVIATSSSISSTPLTSAPTRKQKKNTSRDDDAKSETKSYKSNGSASAAKAKAKLRKRRKERENEALKLKVRNNNKESDDDKEVNANDDWLFDGVTDALGPHDIAADLESLSSKRSCGNKSVKSHRSHRSHRSKKKKGRSSRRNRSDDSVGSRGSRYSVRSTSSQMSQMSAQSRSVANDLLRLEMQLAMVGSEKSKHITGGKGKSGNSVGGKSLTSRKSSNKRSVIAKRSKVEVRAPPGKLGLILANTTDGKGTVVSCVRETSILVNKVSAGDRIIAIDEDDVSRLTVSELTTIMARKTEFERVLTVLKTPKSRESSA